MVVSGTDTSQRTVEECAVPMSAETTMCNLSSSIVSDVGEMHINSPISGVNSVSNQHSNGTLEQEDVCMIDEFEHPLILSRDREIPFTYLASLSAKWAAMKEKEPSVRGKIKVCSISLFEHVCKCASVLLIWCLYLHIGIMCSPKTGCDLDFDWLHLLLN